MNKFLAVVKAIELAAIAFVCIAIGTVVFHANKTLNNLNQTIQNVDTTVTLLSGSVNQTFVTINRSCGDGHPCGTLADVAKTLNTIRGTAGQIEIAAHHEDARIGILDAQETTLFNHTDTAIQNFDVDLQGIRPIEASLNDDALQLKITTQSLNTLISDPSIPPMLASFRQSADNVSQTTGDVKIVVHKWLHPTWVQRLLSGVQTIGIDLGKVFFTP